MGVAAQWLALACLNVLFLEVATEAENDEPIIGGFVLSSTTRDLFEKLPSEWSTFKPLEVGLSKEFMHKQGPNVGNLTQVPPLQAPGSRGRRETFDYDTQHLDGTNVSDVELDITDPDRLETVLQT